MIKYSVTDTPTLAVLQRRSETFYLTGSRYFNTAYPTGEWDFFVRYSEKLMNDLVDIGFHEPTTGYPDCLTRLVLSKTENGIKYDIQLVTNPEIKKKVQSIIKEQHYEIPTDKVARATFWTLCFTLVLEGIKDDTV